MMVVATTSCGVGGGGGSRTSSLPTTLPSGSTLPSLGGGSAPSITSTPTTTPTLTATTSLTVTGTTAGSSSNDVSYWWFVAAAVLVALLAIILGVMRHRRRSGQDWNRQVQRVGALGATVHDVVSSTTTTLMQPLSPERALAIDQRINDLDVELHRLEPAAPNEETALRVSAAVAALGSLRTAVGMLVDVAPGDALARSAGVVDARLADFDAALRGVTAD
jgi:hypothetical protein